MAPKRTKSPTFAVLPHREGKPQDVFFYHIEKIHGQLQIDEKLREKYMAHIDAGKDVIVALLVKAGITVRYYDPEEKKWMDHSESGGLEPVPGDRDGGWVQPSLESFKSEYLAIRFGATANT